MAPVDSRDYTCIKGNLLFFWRLPLGQTFYNRPTAGILLSLFCLSLFHIKGERGAVCWKRFTFLYTSPYDYVQYNVSGPFVFNKCSVKNSHNYICG